MFRDVDRPSYTITSSARRLVINNGGAGESVSRRALSGDRDIDNPATGKLRALTLAETATLQGFPSTYDWEPAKFQKYRWTIIGNAVPPPMMAAVIRGVQQ